MGSPFLLSIWALFLSSVPSSDHDDRWETKEAVSAAPEPPQPAPPKEAPTQVGQAVRSWQAARRGGAWGLQPIPDLPCVPHSCLRPRPLPIGLLRMRARRAKAMRARRAWMRGMMGRMRSGKT